MQFFTSSSGSLFVCVLILMMVTVDFADAGTIRPIDCRKYVLAPECRGVSAKRDTREHLNEDYRILPDDVREIPHDIDSRREIDEMMANNRAFLDYLGEP